MNVRWADQRTIVVSDAAEWRVFDAVAEELARALDGAWTERLDGLDERWWDLEAAGGKITLHLQPFLGITAFVHRDSHGCERSRALLDRAFGLLRGCVSPDKV